MISMPQGWEMPTLRFINPHSEKRTSEGEIHTDGTIRETVLSERRGKLVCPNYHVEKEFQDWTISVDNNIQCTLADRRP